MSRARVVALAVCAVATLSGGLITTVPASAAAGDHRSSVVRSVHDVARKAKAPKAGEPCPAGNKGKTVSTKSGYLKWVKKNGKLVWKKVPAPTPPTPVCVTAQPSINISSCNLAGVNLSNMDLSGANLTNANLMGANLANAIGASTNILAALCNINTVLPGGGVPQTTLPTTACV